MFGPGGHELSERWRDGASAHLGITVPRFPNLCLLYAEHEPRLRLDRAHAGVQIGYVRQALELLRCGVPTLTVRPEVAARFDAEVQQRLAHSVWTGCRSCYRTASRRTMNNWPGTMREYARRTRRLDGGQYVAQA
ncbi:hypothetical protein FHX44_114225 [Pseudonocardia hierapolitana]|uniref:Uncharacterized protein n=1 Tax=Pseudonocardia hierapolitana TaxID=1128676 RepID=A0A561STX7_9PSEU|nr:hypothetical protein [Pseudonocardia hierapolitana]TWF78302.1 hypothetical protein FHX44_114225 [Pseudonocardia hierapolitana]